MEPIPVVTGALVVLMLLALPVAAASVTPVLVDPWKSGDAYFECSQIGSTCDFAWKLDWDSSNNGVYGPLDGGNTITISNDDGSTFDWATEYPVCAVIVKAGTGAYVYWYHGAYSDTGLVAPYGKEISHVTFCYNEPDMCWKEETAWAQGAPVRDHGQLGHVHPVRWC